MLVHLKIFLKLGLINSALVGVLTSGLEVPTFLLFLSTFLFRSNLTPLADEIVLSFSLLLGHEVRDLLQPLHRSVVRCLLLRDILHRVLLAEGVHVRRALALLLGFRLLFVLIQELVQRDALVHFLGLLGWFGDRSFWPIA